MFICSALICATCAAFSCDYVAYTLSVPFMLPIHAVRTLFRRELHLSHFRVRVSQSFP